MQQEKVDVVGSEPTQTVPQAALGAGRIVADLSVEQTAGRCRMCADVIANRLLRAQEMANRALYAGQVPAGGRRASAEFSGYRDFCSTRPNEAPQLGLGPAQSVYRGHIKVPYARLVRYVEEAQALRRVWSTEKSGAAEPESRGLVPGAAEVYYW